MQAAALLALANPLAGAQPGVGKGVPGASATGQGVGTGLFESLFAGVQEAAAPQGVASLFVATPGLALAGPHLGAVKAEAASDGSASTAANDDGDAEPDATVQALAGLAALQVAPLIQAPTTVKMSVADTGPATKPTALAAAKVALPTAPTPIIAVPADRPGLQTVAETTLGAEPAVADNDGAAGSAASAAESISKKSLFASAAAPIVSAAPTTPAAPGRQPAQAALDLRAPIASAQAAAAPAPATSSAVATTVADVASDAVATLPQIAEAVATPQPQAVIPSTGSTATAKARAAKTVDATKSVVQADIPSNDRLKTEIPSLSEAGAARLPSPEPLPTSVDGQSDAPAATVADAKPDEAQQSASPIVQDQASPTLALAANAPLQAAPVTPAKADAETVAHLAGQIVRKSEGKASRFDIVLEPAGLGRVDVKVEIGAQGQLTAAMSFDSPQAAAELRARAADLQNALQQAGFDVSQSNLTFTSGGDQGFGRGLAGQQQGDQQGGSWQGRAFAQAADAADLPPDTAALARRLVAASGVDIRV